MNLPSHSKKAQLRGYRSRVLFAGAMLMVPSLAGAQLSAIDDYGAFGYGDAIRITIWEGWEKSDTPTFASKFSGDYIIDGEGYIVLPIFGKMNVIGVTPERFTAILREKLAPFTSDPIIMVVPLIRVTLMGEFRRPGSYRADPSIALWGLIEEAGGPGEECNFRKMRLMRGDKTVVQSLSESWEKGWSLSEIGVRTGDIIYAPAKPRITFRDFVYYFQFVVSILSLYVAFKRWG